MICSNCKLEKPEEEYSYKNKSLGKRQTTCKVCHKEYVKNHYIENAADYKARAKANSPEYVKRNTEAFLEMLFEMSCERCGEDDPVVLEFHHIGEKTTEVARLYRQAPRKALEEMTKCQVLCANCHKRQTAKDYNWKRLTYTPVSQR